MAIGVVERSELAERSPNRLGVRPRREAEQHVGARSRASTASRCRSAAARAAQCAPAAAVQELPAA